MAIIEGLKVMGNSIILNLDSHHNCEGRVEFIRTIRFCQDSSKIFA